MAARYLSRIVLLAFLLIGGLHISVTLARQAVQGAPALKPSLDPPWTASVRVNSRDGTYDALAPDIAVDPKGNAYATWCDNREHLAYPHDADIYFSYRPAGGSWMANERVNTDIPNDDILPSIAVDPHGNAYAAWREVMGSEFDIYFSYRPAGGSWGPNQRVNDDSGTVDRGEPSIDVDAAANAYAVWTDDRLDTQSDIYFSYRPAGGSWETNVRVNDDAVTESAGQGSPHIAVDPEGNAHAIWVDYRDGVPLHIYASYRSAGGSWEANVRLSENTGTPFVREFPSIAVDVTGNAYSVWRQSSSSGSRIYFAYRRAGDTWGPATRLDELGSIRSCGMDIAVDPNGNAYLVWPGWSDDTYHLFFSYRPAGGPWQPVERVDDYPGDPGTACWPAIAADSSGNAYEVWPDPRNGSWDIYFSYRPAGALTPPDLAIDSVLPAQVVEGQDLVVDKPTAVKVVVRKTGPDPLSNVQVKVTYEGHDYTSFYVSEPGNWDSNFVLQQPNTTYPLDFGSADVTKTVYFFGHGLAPEGPDSYVVTAEVDYDGAIAEADETNNTNSGTSAVYHTSWPLSYSGHFFGSLDIAYVKADWDATPNSEFDSLVENSRAYLGDVLPLSESGLFAGEFSDFTGADSIDYRGADNQLNREELRQWFLNLNQLLIQSQPTNDAFVAVLPHGWFKDYTTWCQNCTGLTYPPSTQLGLVELSSYGGIAGHKTVAHELGHVFGLCLECEQYADCNPDRVDGIGSAVYNGLWVDSRRLMDYSAQHRVYCFMGASANEDFWIDSQSYDKLLDDRKFTQSASALSVVAADAGDNAILVVGTLFEDGHIELEDWYVLDPAQTDELQPGDYYLRYLDVNHEVLSELSFGLSLSPEGLTVTEVPFVFRVPYVAGTAEVVIGTGMTDVVSRTVSAHGPMVTVLSPNGGERIEGSATISWSSDDEDGDELSHTVLLSRDGGATWTALATDLNATSYPWDVSSLPGGSTYLVKVRATDGFNTSEDSSDAVFSVGYYAYLPAILKGY